MANKIRSLICCITAIVAPIGLPSLYACSTPPGKGYNYAWLPGTSVTVNIDPHFPAVSDGETAANNWKYGIVTNLPCSSLSMTVTSVSNPSTGAGSLNVYYTTLNNVNPDGSDTVKRGVMTPTFNGFGRLASATAGINQYITDNTTVTEVIAHEIGHTFGLADCTGCTFNTSVMNTGATTLNEEIGVTGPTSCDFLAVATTVSDYDCPPPPPTCCDTGNCQDRFQCDGSCHCVNASPIIVDIEGEGFHLTSSENGVNFDIGAVGRKERIGWTDPKYHNALLVLDRDHDGTIDSGKELFGGATPQPPSKDPNGFTALAVFDLPENGGNGDGTIDARDEVWHRLRLWIDSNHDGISQPEELHKLQEEGVYSIGLDFKITPRRDEYGNQFVYKGRVNVNGERRDEVNRVTYDVIFSMAGSHCQKPKSDLPLLEPQ
jgi:hypothetical protein